MAFRRTSQTLVSFLKLTFFLFCNFWFGLFSVTAQTQMFRDPPELLKYLDSLSVLENDSNKTAIYFASLYRLTTENILKLKEEGKFRNPDRIDSMICEFGTRFAMAVIQNKNAPTPWHQAFYLNKPRSDMQLLLLAINAHINYDLPETLLQFHTRQAFQPNDPDFFLIDQVYESLSQQIFSNLLGASDLNKSEQRLLNRYLKKSIRMGKKWRSDLMRWVIMDADNLHRKKNLRSKRMSFWIAHPVGKARKLHRILHRIENESIQGNIRIWFQSAR